WPYQLALKARMTAAQRPRCLRPSMGRRSWMSAVTRPAMIVSTAFSLAGAASQEVSNHDRGSRARSGDPMGLGLQLRFPLQVLAHALVGRWTGRGHEAPVVEQLAASPVHQHRLHFGAGLLIDDDDALALRGELPVAPSKQGPDHRPEVAPAGRQQVFVPRRML